MIPFPRDRVYRAYRDELPAIAKYIPDIDRIEVLDRRATEHGVVLHNEWVSSREVPAYARAFVSPEQLAWDDYADWRDGEFAVHWRLGARVFTEAVSCAGVNRFLDDPAGTRVALTGDLAIDLLKVPGFPRFLADRIAPEVERFVIGLVTPNLERVNASVGRFLEGA